MAYKNAYAAYHETRIKTANQGQLIIMLYDGVLKHLDAAIEYMSENERAKQPALIEKYGKAVIKAQSIISELAASLDFEQGKEIADGLFSLYSWFNHELLDANIYADAARVKNVRQMMANLRVAWLEVIEKKPAAAGGDGAENAVNINVAG